MLQGLKNVDQKFKSLIVTYGLNVGGLGVSDWATPPPPQVLRIRIKFVFQIRFWNADPDVCAIV
jgi:hypothetical protein